MLYALRVRVRVRENVAFAERRFRVECLRSRSVSVDLVFLSLFLFLLSVRGFRNIHIRERGKFHVLQVLERIGFRLFVRCGGAHRL